MEQLINKYNMAVGAGVALLTYIFGEQWYLFGAFLLMNIADWLTGWYKSYVSHTENSHKGLSGVFKKLCYWIMIAVAFIMSTVFIQIGETIGVNLHVTTLFGWFVLASLFINEIRSVLENLVEADVYVPAVLKKGLEVADRVLDKADDVIGDDIDE